MTRKIKITALIMAIVCTLSLLSGCNKKGASGSTQSSDKKISTEATEDVSAEESSDSPEASVSSSNSKKKTSSTSQKAEIVENNTFSSLNWSADASGRTTVENQPNYVFDEDQYYGVAMNGGTYTRAKDFVRGLCPQTDFGSAGDNVSQDRQNFNDLRITSFRSYGGSDNPTITANLSQGKTTMPTWNGSMQNVPKSLSYKYNWLDDCYYTSGFQFANDSIYPAVQNVAQKLVSLTAYKGLEALLLANEYCNYNYGGGGYDATTLKYFRSVWLPSRFGTVVNLNQQLKTSYESFDSVYTTPAMENGNMYIKYEFWLCLRATYEKFMKFNYDAVKAVNPQITVSYASYHGNTDPYSNYARIGFMDAGAMNIYKEGISFTSNVDQQLALYANKPFYVTETSAPIFDSAKYTTPDALKAAYQGMAKRIKQYLPLAYMRPQVQGTYYFSYCYDDREGKLFNIVDPYHMPNPAFYGLEQCYQDFEYLDAYYTGSSSSPIVAVTNAVTDEITSSDSSTNSILKALYANGVTVQLIDSDMNSEIANCSINKMILCDKTLYQDPDGSNDAASALVQYASGNGNSVISLNKSATTTLYGKGSWNSDTFKQLVQNKVVEESQTDTVWSVLAPFLHDDFITGKVPVSSNTVNADAVRILDASMPDDGNDFTANPVNNIQQQIVYKNGHVYLCVVNTGSSAINNLTLTLGINNGVKFNFHPEVLKADGKVTVSKTKRAVIPDWMSQDVIKNNRITYGTVNIDNLSTYAFVDLGMAVVG